MNKWTQFQGVFQREVFRFLKVPLQTVGAPIINAFLYLLIFGVSLGKSIELSNNVSYLAFLIPGLIAMSVIKNTFDNSTSSIVGQKYMNELQDLRVTPLSIQQLCFGKALASLTRGIIVGVVTGIIGELFYQFQLSTLLHIAHPIVFLYFLLTGGMAFGLLGIAIGMWAKTFEHVGAISALVLLPLIYLGGVFFNITNVHPIWQKISYANPLFFIINGIRYGVLGLPDPTLYAGGIVSFGFCFLCYVLAFYSLKKGSRYIR